MKRCVLQIWLLLFLVAAGQARAGLFSDDETRKQIKELEGRISLLEDSEKERTRVIMNLQGQVDALTEQLRKQQGLNEELHHSLQDAEKRQKDFYIDLDSRLRRVEALPQGQGAAGVATNAPGGTPVAAPVAPAAPIDTVAESKDFDAANKLFKTGKLQASVTAFQGFLKKYTGSTLSPNAHYKMGVAYFELKDYKNAANSYQTVASQYPDNQMAPSALYGAALSYQEMGDIDDAKKALNLIIIKYPGNAMVPKAKQRLGNLK